MSQMDLLVWFWQVLRGKRGDGAHVGRRAIKRPFLYYDDGVLIPIFRGAVREVFLIPSANFRQMDMHLH
jgi:hypothetical protein